MGIDLHRKSIYVISNKNVYKNNYNNLKYRINKGITEIMST